MGMLHIDPETIPSWQSLCYMRMYWSSFFSREKTHSQYLIRVSTQLENPLSGHPTASCTHPFMWLEKTAIASSGRIMKDLVPMVDKCGRYTEMQQQLIIARHCEFISKHYMHEKIK